MANMKAFFRSTSPYANGIAAVATITWLMKILWLDTIPAAFSKAPQLGKFVEVTLSQVVASYIFYLFFVHWQETQDRQTVAPYIVKHASRVFGDCMSQLAEVSRVSGHFLDFDKATETDVRDAFKATLTSARPNMVIDRSGTPATWFQYFWHHQERTKGSISRVIQLGRLVSADLAKRLVDVEDAPFFYSVESAISFGAGNSNLETWGGSFFKYLVACRRVKDWVDAHP